MKKNNNGKLRIIPLGGLEQIGMNITAFEYEDSIIVVDCGLSFPEDDMLGIDLVIPDITYLKENIDKVKGFVITHGHEDHIGALPYVLREINVPIYATKLTVGLIDNKLKEHNLLRTTKRKVIKHGQSINLGCFRIEFIKTNHSIQDASALDVYKRQNDKTAVEADLNALKDILAKCANVDEITDAQVEEIKAGKEKLMQSAQKLFAKMYEQAQAQGGAQAGPDMGAGAQGGSNEAYGDDVVDGDYREV